LVKTYALGIYPRSDKLIEATRKNDERLPQLFQMAKRKLIREQQEAKLTYVSDPLLDWNDMFRPFSAVKNVRAGALNRFFETNTFYRKLIINGDLNGSPVVKSHLALSLLPKKKEIAACLPDPNTFAQLNENRFYKDRTEYLFAVADMLKREAKALAASKVKLIQLNAPSIAYNSESIDLATVKDAVERVKDGVKAKVYLHLYFGNISKIFSKLLDVKVDGLSVDLSHTDIKSLTDFRVDRGLCLGVINSMNTKMEDVKETAKIVARALDKMSPKEAYISTTCDLEFLPYDFAVKKLSRLGAIGRKVQYE
jgi:methionine synthase II (cobalamin-independent)